MAARSGSVIIAVAGRVRGLYMSVSNKIAKDVEEGAIDGSRDTVPLIGEHLVCFYGFSTDRTIRLCGAAGGVVTSTLLYAIKSGYSKTALVTGSTGEYIARNEDDIINAMGSKYCLIPHTKLKAGIVVGLPCRISRHKGLKIGLFCSGTPNEHATEYLTWKAKRKNPRSVVYRGCGYPGDAYVDGVVVRFNDYYHTGFGQYFHEKKCLRCKDVTAEKADISVGDAWIPRAWGTIGANLVIVRTQRGMDLIQDMVRDGVVHLEEVSPDVVLESQGEWTIKFRKGAKGKRAFVDWQLLRVGRFIAARGWWRTMVCYTRALSWVGNMFAKKQTILKEGG